VRGAAQDSGGGALGIIARRSSASSPCSKRACSSPSSSCSESSSPSDRPHCDHTSRSTPLSTPATISCNATVTICCTKPLWFFIIPGAFSASSTINSTASRRVADSRLAFMATCPSIAVVRSARCGLRKRTFTSEISSSASIPARPEISRNSDSASAPPAPKPAGGCAPMPSQPPMQRSMCESRGWSGFISFGELQLPR